MFFKIVYKSLFSISSYIEAKKKSLLSGVVYAIVLSLLCGLVFAGIGYYKQKPIMNEKIDKIYESIPNFKLSDKGLEVDGNDNPLRINFAGANIYVDDSRDFIDLVLDEKIEREKEILFVGRNGYAKVEGNTLKSGNFFSDVPALKDQNLVKDDFNLIYEMIRMMNRDIVILVLLICVLIFTIATFVRSLVYAVFLKIIMALNKGKINFKKAYIVSLYANTFYCVYWSIAIFTDMNINLFYRVMLLELISLMYIVLIGLKFIKEGGK